MTDLAQWVRERYGPADVDLLDIYPDYYDRQYRLWLARQQKAA
jgi:hypothetical protein